MLWLLRRHRAARLECGRSGRDGAFARSSPTPAATATAARTRASSGACACTGSSLPTAPRERSRSSPPTGPSGRSRSSSCRGRCGAAKRSSATRATQREFEAAVGELGALVLRPARKDEPDNGLHLSTIRQRIESVFQTCKDILTLERQAPAPWQTSGPGSGSGSWRSPLRSTQPLAQTTEPLARGLRGLSGWNQTSRRGPGTRTRGPAPSRRSGPSWPACAPADASACRVDAAGLAGPGSS